MGHSDSAEPSPKTPVTPKAPAEKPTETTFGISAAPGGFGSIGQNTVAPSGFRSVFGGDAAKSPAPSFSAPKPAESSNQSAPASGGFKSAFGGDAAKSPAPSFSAPKPAESSNQSAPASGGFKSAFGGDAAKSPAPSFSAPKPTAGEPPAAKEKGTAGSPATEWRCKVCNKTKDLHGDHLKGKTEVRSDCWPCAKKQTFILFEDGEPVKNQSTVARPSAVKGDAEEKDAVQEAAGHGPASSASVPPEKTTPQVDSGLNFDSIVADPRIPDELLEHLFLLPIDETTLHWRQPPFPPELIEKIDQVHSMSMHGEEYLSQFAEATFEQFESLSKSADVFEKDLSVCLDKLTVAEEVPKRLERLEKDSAAVKEALSHQSSELSKIVGMLKENKEELNAIKGILSNVESHLFNNYYAAQPSVAAPEPTRTLGNTTTSPQRHLENAFLKLK
ncbi:hypothetical protein AGDE_12955 [Angomonas deanei]|nr:hypothetical protein AGDE_12955 [Angomonas deanei]|eukprot:EPY23200.1 hypothetical protein AGDE_12955 [Angomonas deanei]